MVVLKTALVAGLGMSAVATVLAGLVSRVFFNFSGFRCEFCCFRGLFWVPKVFRVACRLRMTTQSARALEMVLPRRSRWGHTTAGNARSAASLVSRSELAGARRAPRTRNT